MNIFKTANNYISTCDWKDLALMKFCLVGLGMMAGGILAKKYRKEVICVGASLFTATYIPVMAKVSEKIVEDLKNDN